MTAGSLRRLALVLGISLLALAGPAPLVRAGGGKDAPSAPPRLVVHEWGTFTTVAGQDGVAVDWRPLSGPTELPGFVYDHRNLPKGVQAYEETKGGRVPIRMETPVLYFYADRETTVTVDVRFPKGTVTEWIWANPHCFLKFDVKSESGAVKSWMVETQNPTDMTRRGWSRLSFKAGDAITVRVEPVKGTAPVGRILSVVLPNGETLWATGGPPAPAQ